MKQYLFGDCFNLEVILKIIKLFDCFKIQVSRMYPPPIVKRKIVSKSNSNNLQCNFEN